MYRFLVRPKWIGATLFVIVVAVLFVNLGFWQLRRLQERRLLNEVQGARYEAPAADVETLVQAAGNDVATLEYRRATADGVFDPQHEVLLRSQVYQGQPGWHVITPLLLADGKEVLVDRGWVPYEMDTPPVTAVTPASGTVEITGVVRPTQLRRIGPIEPAGRLQTVARIDIDRLRQQFDHPLLPVWLQIVGPAESLPIPAEVPTFTDQGPHLSYAIQWFSFTLIGLVGYAFLIRREGRRTRRAEADPGT